MSASSKRSSRRRRLQLCLLASLAVHLLLIWAYQRWAAEPLEHLLRPVLFEPPPEMVAERFEPVTSPAIPQVDMERAEPAEVELPAPPEVVSETPPMLEARQPLAVFDRDLAAKLRPAVAPGDTVDLDGALADLHRRKLLELSGRRMRVVPLADTSSDGFRRRRRAEEIIDRAIEALGGLDRLQAVRDMRIAAEVWSFLDNRWEPAGTRYWLRGEKYREELQRGMVQGYDGTLSWLWRFGILRPAPDLRQAAQRWDFLSRFRGDGVVVEYVGRRQMQYRQVEAIRVIDAEFGRQRLAYFDVRGGLLTAEAEGGVTTLYQEYREASGILVPSEVWRIVGPNLAQYRWETGINPGLTGDLFAVPEARTWDPEMVQLVLFEHLRPPGGGAPAHQVLLEQVDQKWQPPAPSAVTADPATLELLNVYLREKLRAAGALATGGRATWRLRCRIERFHATIRMPPPPRYTMVLSVNLSSLREGGLTWRGEVERSWLVLDGPPVDDRVGDDLTYSLISQVSSGLAQVGAGAPEEEKPAPPPARTEPPLAAETAQPDSTPSRSSSSSSP